MKDNELRERVAQLEGLVKSQGERIRFLEDQSREQVQQVHRTWIRACDLNSQLYQILDGLLKQLVPQMRGGKYQPENHQQPVEVDDAREVGDGLE
jgi:hypothetical protein